jgi:hypothetical protein
MNMMQRDFDLVASSILHMRGKVQTDLDWGYSVNGAVILDQLTERLAADFAAQYRHFNRHAFIDATQGSPYSDDFTGGASSESTVSCRLVYTVGCRRNGDLPEADTHSFDTFEDAKAAMASKLHRYGKFYAQLHDQTGIRIIEAIQDHLCNAKGPEWEHSDGSYEFRISSARR